MLYECCFIVDCKFNIHRGVYNVELRQGWLVESCCIIGLVVGEVAVISSDWDKVAGRCEAFIVF